MNTPDNGFRELGRAFQALQANRVKLASIQSKLEAARERQLSIWRAIGELQADARALVRQAGKKLSSEMRSELKTILALRPEAGTPPRGKESFQPLNDSAVARHLAI